MKFQRLNKKFYHILWDEPTILDIMNDGEKFIYKNYKKKIQKADYARYIVLKYYGGIYCDYDIDIEQSIYDLYNSHKTDNIVLFEESTMSNYQTENTRKYIIRNNIPETSLRIANYIIMAKPHSVEIDEILDLCKERSVFKINEDYDILYTTGPDVVTTVYEKHKNNIKYVPLNVSNKYFKHLCAGHWRDD